MFIEGSQVEPIYKFEGLSKLPINPYALQPGSSFKLSEYPINPYALKPKFLSSDSLETETLDNSNDIQLSTTSDSFANDDSLNISTKNSTGITDSIDNDISSSNNNSSNSPPIETSKTVFLNYTDPADFSSTKTSSNDTLQFAPSRTSLVKEILNKNKNSSSKFFKSKSKFKSYSPSPSNVSYNYDDTDLSDYDNDYEDYQSWMNKK